MAIYSDATLSKSPPRLPEASRSVRGRAILFMVIALGAGLSSAWLVLRYHASAAAPVDVHKVVVAAVDVPVASKLTPDMMRLVDWPASAEPQGSFASSDELGGRVVGTPLTAGEPITERRLSPKGATAGMASLIPANMRAMTVPVNEVIGVGGFIHPGDLVDVITTMQEPVSPQNVGAQQEFRSKIVLQNIRVLAVGQQLATDSNKPETVPAVTLLVSPEDAERLALASTHGKLQLTMRSPLDGERLDTPGVSPPELLGLPASQPAAAQPAAPAQAPVAVAARARPTGAGKARVAEAAPAPPPTVDVVEVLHGDRIEKRKFTTKVSP